MDTVRSTRHFFNGQPVAPQPISSSKLQSAQQGVQSKDLSVVPGLEELVCVLREALAGGQSGCFRLFVAGAVSHVGKTTVCLSLLQALRSAGLQPEDVAYIKPATQCEAPDLLARWCEEEGIEHVSGEQAPLVFYSGFTRSFLLGEQGTSKQWLDKISARVDALALGRRVLIIDGVGFPAVGSIVGVDNADVAKALRAPVLLVCKSGVGGAVDSFSLNSIYFNAKDVPVLGAVFNFGALEGAYSWDKCAENISLFFNRGTRPERFYGVVPLAPELDGLRERVAETGGPALLELARLNAGHFAEHVAIGAIFRDAAAHAWNGGVHRKEPGSEKPPSPWQDAPALAPPAFAPKLREAVSPAAKGGG